jgi:hypothetical protein
VIASIPGDLDLLVEAHDNVNVTKQVLAIIILGLNLVVRTGRLDPDVPVRDCTDISDIKLSLQI